VSPTSLRSSRRYAPGLCCGRVARRSPGAKVYEKAFVNVPARNAVMRWSLTAWLGVVLGAFGCAGPTTALHSPPPAGFEGPGVELTATPFFRQEGFQCGPTALATILAASGVGVTPADLTSEVYLPGRRGSLQLELLAATRRHGRLPYEIADGVAGLVAELRGGRPVLVLQNLGWQRWPVWHYAVVVGTLTDPDRFVLRSGGRERLVVAARDFLRSWEGGELWGVVALRPGEMPARVDRHTYLKAVAALEGAGQAESARAAYHAALALWPDDPVARLGLGNSAFALGEWAEAEAAYRQLLDQEPGNVIARNNLAQVLAEQGEYSAALAEIEGALAEEGVSAALRQALSDTRREITARAARVAPKIEDRAAAP
jgi:hypothetical protein